MKINSKIRQLRLEKGFTQYFMAIQLSLCLKTYRNLESGISELKLKTLFEISKILETPPLKLISSDERFFSEIPGQENKVNLNNGGISNGEKKLYEKLLSEKDELIKLLKLQNV